VKRNAVGLGGASLVLIFSILCLAIFSVLALSSANREKTLTDRLKASTEAYYAADSRAVEIEVKLREALARGETPSEIDGVTVTAQDDTYTYACPIDERRTLAVVLKAARNQLPVTLQTLQWCEISTADWTPQEELDVWKGD
jgi:hypothetical protein